MHNESYPTSSIKLLPDHIINQIKAGEVIERPASIIKELLENSIDAKSTQIDICLREQGLELLSIEDNGTGMKFNELPLAFIKHATSKLNLFEDLYRLRSFGFRGEALSSIASVARIECISSCGKKKLDGGKYTIHGGKETEHIPFNSDAAGTSIYVRDLFYNTPARLKFMKSKQAEQNAINRIVNAFILSNSQITFTIKSDSKDKKIYPKINNIEERIKIIFSDKKNTSGPLLIVNKNYEGYNIKGFFSYTTNKSKAFKKQFLFANNRLFFDKKIHQIILRSLDGFWPYGEIGHYTIFLTLPRDEMDVNVHPGKTFIKFFKESYIYSLISESIKKSISEIKLAPSHPKLNINFPTNDNHLHTCTDIPLTLGLNSPCNNTTSFILTHNFISFQKDKRYILHLEKLIKYYLQEKISQNILLRDDQIIPLLISEPYRRTTDKLKFHISPLKKIGLEFSQIEEQLFILRSIPYYLADLPIDQIIIPLLNLIEKNDSTIKNKEFIKSIQLWPSKIDGLNTNNLNINIIDNIINQFATEKLIQNKIANILDDQKLIQILEGK